MPDKTPVIRVVEIHDIIFHGKHVEVFPAEEKEHSVSFRAYKLGSAIWGQAVAQEIHRTGWVGQHLVLVDDDPLVVLGKELEVTAGHAERFPIVRFGIEFSE
tara:strand:- start:273 stop:578 length:306 start_codon:yes stop_codon:yes gene_type:complete